MEGQLDLSVELYLVEPASSGLAISTIVFFYVMQPCRPSQDIDMATVGNEELFDNGKKFMILFLCYWLSLFCNICIIFIYNPIPCRLWSHIDFDFVNGLPFSSGNIVILTIVNFFPKTAHVLALPNLLSALETARLLIDNILQMHGSPADLVSNRCPR